MEIVSSKWSFHRLQFCDGCGKHDCTEVLKPCSKCGTVVYCNKYCQTNHWHIHKSSCDANKKAQQKSWEVYIDKFIKGSYDDIVKHLTPDVNIYVVKLRIDKYAVFAIPDFDSRLSEAYRKLLGVLTKIKEPGCTYKIVVVRSNNFTELYIVKTLHFVYTSFYTDVADVNRLILNMLPDRLVLALTGMNKYLYEMCDEKFWRSRFRSNHGLLLEENKLCGMSYRGWLGYYLTHTKSNPNYMTCQHFKSHNPEVKYSNSPIKHDHLNLYINRATNFPTPKFHMGIMYMGPNNQYHRSFSNGEQLMIQKDFTDALGFGAIDIYKYLLPNAKITPKLFKRICLQGLPVVQCLEIKKDLKLEALCTPKLVIELSKKGSADLIRYLLEKINYGLDIKTIKKCHKMAYSAGNTSLVEFYEDAFPEEKLSSTQLKCILLRCIKRGWYSAFENIYNMHPTMFSFDEILKQACKHNRVDVVSFVIERNKALDTDYVSFKEVALKKGHKLLADLIDIYAEELCEKVFVEKMENPFSVLEETV